jgi:DNA-binding FrmR family transcriptional regulator
LYFSDADDDGDKIMSILEDQTQVLKQILEEQRKTNKILSQLFAVNAEP